MSLTSILNTYWLEEMIKREELNVALETFNLLLVDVWVTTLKLILIAAFLLNIDLSERSSKNDLKTRSVMLKSSTMCTYSAQNLWADHSIMKSEDLQSYEIITLEVRKSSLCRLSILMSICSICINKCDFDYISYEKRNSDAMSHSSFNLQILEISSFIIQDHSTCERWSLRWLRKLRAKRFFPSKDYSR